MTARELLRRLRSVKRNGKGWLARCPAHDDSTPSLSVTEKDGKTLLHCFGGCSQEAVWSALGVELNGKRPSRITTTRSTAIVPSVGCSLVEYAEFKGLSMEKLKEFGVADTKAQGAAMVAIPYRDPAHKVVATQYRRALTGEDKFRWHTGDHPTLYGLWRAKDGESIALVEGASDCHTLWSYGIAALGLPGASTWKEDFTGYFSAFERVNVKPPRILAAIKTGNVAKVAIPLEARA